VEAIVADCHAANRRLRVVGSALSPNGIGFSQEGMMSMALLDKVVRVDAAAKQVGVRGCLWCVTCQAHSSHFLGHCPCWLVTGRASTVPLAAETSDIGLSPLEKLPGQHFTPFLCTPPRPEVPTTHHHG
jgi:hypothetical protein